MTTLTSDAEPGADVPPTVPLILLPGMGADGRLFKHQREAFADLVVPPWLVPARRETVSAYAERMARAVDPNGPCVIGGASFGGFVAVEMARHLDARAVVLIGSARSPAEFGPALRAMRVLSPLIRVVPFRAVATTAGVVARCGGDLLSPATGLVLRQLAASDGWFLRWASEAVLKWRATPLPPRLPVYQIHGGRDRVLPTKHSRADEFIPGGGHVISLSHARAVNAFLRRHLSEHLRPAGALGAAAASTYDGPPKETPPPWPSTPPAS
jgi:pimeloyl-ACP methyl ester carboxylesterase